MDKRCPYCGGEMLLGYMQSRDGVYWSMKKKLVPALPGLAKDELYLSDGSAAVEAYNCPKCRVILNIEKSTLSGRFFIASTSCSGLLCAFSSVRCG